MTKNEKRGRLYVVSTHIGNPEDVTVRAANVLKLCDLVVCEEIKEGSILLKQLQINKKLDTLNEQNEEERVAEYLNMILEYDMKLALISDCGTPVFADPGYNLVRQALQMDVNVTIVPGVTSLMTALVRSGLPITQFLYAGFLSRKQEERLKQLADLSKESRTVVIYDTPYRLLPLLEDASKVMPNRQAYIGMNLTMPFETHHYGTFSELYNKFKAERIKAEFVICFEQGAQIAFNTLEESGSLDRKTAFTSKRPIRTNTFRNNGASRDRKFSGASSNRDKFSFKEKGKFDNNKKSFRDRPFDKNDRNSKKSFSKKKYDKK